MVEVPKVDVPKVDYEIEKSILDTSKSKSKAGNLKSKSKLTMQKEKGKSILDVKPDEDDISILVDNMDNFLCPMCELVRFCNITCLRTNVDRVNCHPCSDFLKAKYFPTPSGTDLVENQVDAY